MRADVFFMYVLYFNQPKTAKPSDTICVLIVVFYILSIKIKIVLFGTNWLPDALPPVHTVD